MNPPRRPQFPTLPPASPTAACGCAFVTAASGLRVPAHEAAACDPLLEDAVAPECPVWRARVARGARQAAETRVREFRANRHEFGCDCMECRPWTS